MRALLRGTIVDLESRPVQAADGTNRVYYSAYLTPGTPREAAPRVGVEPEQFRALAIGDDVEWPVDFFTGKDRRGEAYMSVRLAKDFMPLAPGGHAQKLEKVG